MAEKKGFTFRIKAILVSKFNLDLREELAKLLQESEKPFSEYTFEANCVNQGFIPIKLVNFVVVINVFLDKEKKILLGSIQVENLYEVEELERFYVEDENRLNLPFNAEITLLSMSLAHAR